MPKVSFRMASASRESVAISGRNRPMPEDVRALAVGPSQAETVRSPIGGDVVYLARGEQTGGALTALKVGVPPGEGPPLHRHTREEEWVYVLDGHLRWK